MTTKSLYCYLAGVALVAPHVSETMAYPLAVFMLLCGIIFDIRKAAQA